MESDPSVSKTQSPRVYLLVCNTCFSQPNWHRGKLPLFPVLHCFGRCLNSHESAGLQDPSNSTPISPKPIFHQVNGKQKSNSQRVPTETNPHHEDIVRYISEDWNRVYREYEMNKQQPTEGRGVPVVRYYQDKSTTPLLQNFKPFDLESWWGQRMYHNLTHNT